MRDRSNTINVSIVLLAVVLSVVFTVGIVQNLNVQQAPPPVQPGEQGEQEIGRAHV